MDPFRAARHRLVVAQAALQELPASREVALSITNAEQAEHWLDAAIKARDEQAGG